MRAKGPCTMCGAVDYELSLGGPGICHICDCGGGAEARAAHLGMKNVALQQAYEKLRERNERLEKVASIAFRMWGFTTVPHPDNQLWREMIDALNELKQSSRV